MIFEKGEVVWAKIQGFPWWPGVVAKVIDQKGNSGSLPELIVNFIGDNSHAKLTFDKVEKFKENFESFSKARTKKLMHSIQLAERIYEGKTTYEAESQRLDGKNRETTSSRRKNPKFSPKRTDDEGDGWNSSTETSSNLPESDHDTANSQSGAHKEKKKRRLKNEDRSSNAFLDSHIMRLPEQTSFRRRKINLQDTPYGYNQYEIEDLKPRKNLKRHSMLRLDSLSPTNSNTQANKDQDFSNAGSETQSQKNLNLVPIEHITPIQSEFKPVSTFPSTITVSHVSNVSLIASMSHVSSNSHDKENQMIEEEELNPTAIFIRKSSELKKKIKQLESQLATYLSTSSTAGVAISTMIHECLNHLSVEALSSEELLCYLQNDMGKLLFALSNILDEFERHALANSINVHPAIKHKIEKVNNLLSTLKIRMISNFLEQQDFVKFFTEDLRQRFREKKEQDKKKEELEKKKEEQEKKEREQDKKKDEKLAEISTNLEKKLHMELLSVKVEFNDLEPTNYEPIQPEPIKIESIKPEPVVEKPVIDTQPPIKNFDDFKFDPSKSNFAKAVEGINVKKETMSPEPEDKNSGALKLAKKQSMPSRTDKSSEMIAKAQKNSTLSELAKNVSNPALRKQVCQKLAKYIEEIYGLKKDVAQEKTINIEGKIRMSSPEMKEEYKNRCLMIMQLIKAKLLMLEEVIDKDPVDWSFLKAKLDKHNAQQKNKKDHGKPLLNGELSPKPDKNDDPKKKSKGGKSPNGPDGF